MNKQLIVLFTFLCYFTFSACAQSDSLIRVMPGRKNSAQQMKKPYVIIISADAFRYDYAVKYHADNLLRLSAEGVQAASMIPSFPSVTHPNHFALMSGLYPSHSGIVGNDFYDPARKAAFKSNDGTFFGEEPFWVTAEKQNLLTATFFWVDANAAMQGVLPTYAYRSVKKKEVTVADRVKAVKNWLGMPEETRPHFISLYFSETDHQGHYKGPDAPETMKAVQDIDDAVSQIAEAAKSSGLPVNFIFVSDHGMTNIDRVHILKIPLAVDKDKFVITSLGATVNLQAKDQADILPLYKKLKAENAAGYAIYLKKDVPANLHYGAKDDKYNRIGDIVLLAKWPETFNDGPVIGAHGYDPDQVKEMHATFFAWGPAFKQHLKIPAFRNVEVYDVMAAILGIKPLPNDGTGALAKEILK